MLFAKCRRPSCKRQPISRRWFFLVGGRPEDADDDVEISRRSGTNNVVLYPVAADLTGLIGLLNNGVGERFETTNELNGYMFWISRS
jgi:hypothetical protein